ncbi:MAG: hypothetical protein N4A68_06235 [Maledivibacter sp.]|jgi:hypothetical protein|nr:hypothetical protein [Maledivibacter sp.]
MVKERVEVYHYDDNYIYYCEKEAEKMYPDNYNKIYPYVKRKCNEKDVEDDTNMNPFPSQETFDEMVDEIYDEFQRDNSNGSNSGKNHNLMRRYDGYLGRDLVSVLLLRELLGRRRGRRRRRRRYYGGYGGYGGYPYLGY